MASLFIEKEHSIPRVFKRRYGMSAETENEIVAKGKITINVSWVIVLLSGMLRLLKVIPPYPAKEIPVTVTYSVAKDSNAINIDRMFYYPHKPSFNFKSQMNFARDDIMIEITQYHLGTTFHWVINDNQLYFNYRSYVLKLHHGFIRLPMGFILGKCYAKEVAHSDSNFSMEVKFIHPWFGTTYEYFGTFEIVEKGTTHGD